MESNKTAVTWTETEP